MKILLVDDDLYILSSLRRMLRSHVVTLTPGGNSALALVQEGRKYDAILCDVNMPAMRGESFYDALLGLDPELAARTVFMTGGGGSAADVAFQEAHPTLMKPFVREQLEQILEPFAPLAGLV
jgi:CheY-like chemotaxis protein